MQPLGDDSSFDSSVWGISAPAPSLLSLPSLLPTASQSPAAYHDQLDEFDDFHTPLESHPPSVAQDDDFADFGDFGEVEDSDANFAFDHASQHPGPAWRPFHPDLPSSLQDLSQQIEEILGSVWPHSLSSLTSDDDLRQVEGIGQILIASSSRDLYSSLLNSPPLMEPISWVRSRIRQQHLIALGLPVNLDEILPQVASKPLHISTRPVSAPPGAANGLTRSTPPSRSSSRAGMRSSTPQPPTRSGPSTMVQLSLGPKPVLDAKKIDDLLKLETDQLNLFPLTKLEKHLADLRTETTNTSSLLTYLLQTRDALQQDSETYNRLIAELVNEAQKTKSGKGKGGVRRSGTLS